MSKVENVENTLSPALSLKGEGVKTVAVTLLKPHTHAGVAYDQAAVDAGVVIEVSEAQAHWLQSLGVI